MFGSEGTEPKPLARLQGPVRVHFSGQISPGLVDRLTWHLERFSLLTGLDLRRVTQRSEANLRITMTTLAEVTQRSGSADTLCLTEYGPIGDALDYADIYIPVGQTVWLDNCMAHELMHAIGFSAHPKDNGNRSVLEQGAPARMRTFTALDAAAIRMLYDPRLRVGLDRDRALPIARIMAAEMLASWPDASRHPAPGDPLGPDGFLALPDHGSEQMAAEPPRVAQ
jgi:hypothetical protein